MKTIKLPSSRLLELLKKNKIASIKELKSALGSNSSMTVFRKLQELNYITSCSHSGKYYTLKRIARFNDMGLWTYNSVLFSSYGTLFDTLKALIEKSENGYTALELEEILNIKPNAVLLELLNKGRIYREKVTGKYVYFSISKTKRIQQKSIRTGNIHKYDDKKIISSFDVDEVKAGIILFFSILDEKQRRLYAGLESLKMGYGGDTWIAELLDIDQKTVAKGRKELLDGNIDFGNIRQAGGGRKQIKKKVQT